MRAAVAADGVAAVIDRSDPVAADGEVLVRVASAGINGADLLQVAGRYPPPPGAPDILGMELAGERLDTGERVMAIVSGGAQAEICAVPEAQLMAVPDSVELAIAGGFPEVFTTAHDALITQAGLRAGERLLVHGAAGGVGTAAVQLGHVLGAHVTATVRSEGSRAGVEALGADAVLDPVEFEEGDVEPFDVILELVGSPNLTANLRALAIGGRIAVIGIGAGAKGEINLALLLAKKGRIFGSTLRGRSVEQKAATARALERDVLPLLATGRLVIPVAARFALDDARAGYERFAAGGKLGKVLLNP